MPRKNSNARLRSESRKIKAKPNFQVSVYIPSRPYHPWGDIHPGRVVAEGRVKVC